MIPLILQAGAGEAPLDIISLLLNASPVVKGVLGLLILMSVASWFVIGSKSLYLSNAASRSTKFQDNFWKTGRLDEIWRISESSAPSPVGEVFRAGYTELAKLQKRRQENVDTAGEALLGDIESIQRALDRARTTAITEMESRVPLLGTTASAAPFIGLFGTVWGIMNSFRSIGAKGAANLATVAPGHRRGAGRHGDRPRGRDPGGHGLQLLLAPHPRHHVRDGDLLERLPQHRAAEVLLAMSMSSGGGGGAMLTEINVTPLVDVMLVLLIIFMVTAPMLQTGVDVNLPQAKAQTIPDDEGKLILTVTKDKRVFLGKLQIPGTTWRRR